jgi:DNA helicase-2/ATP-dependent DNA helicase PcrA
MANKILKALNPQQKKAVTFDNGPLSILAGAGSGKTRTLTHRAAWLILEKEINPNHILLVTFTNKAANEMKNRIHRLLPSGKPPLAATFHSFGAMVLRRDGGEINIPSTFVIYDTKDQKTLIKDIVKKKNLSTRKFSPRKIAYQINAAKNELVSALEYPQYVNSPFEEVVSEVYLAYERKLNQSTALDFGDLLFKVVKLFQKKPEVLGKYQNQYRWILVDEYQDTNQAQYKLTKMLSSQWKNLTVVGDAAQSIYRWRGADYRNLKRLKKDFPDLKTINLERNYRSSQNILDAAYAVINKNTSHPILKLWTDQEKGEKIKLFQAENEKQEALFVAEKIDQLTRRKPDTDTAVLYRTNALSRPLEEAFLRYGIPYSLVGGFGFYERKEVKDCLAYLRLIANPQDLVSQKRAEKIGKRRFKKFKKYRKVIKQKSKEKEVETAEMLNGILNKTGYWDLYDPEDKDDLSRIENIKELLSVAVEFPNLQNFLENVALVQHNQLPDRQADEKPIKLMTLHSAKGLEFDVVFMTGMEEGLFPHSRSMNSKEELEEERRLCYVGMTRARKKLYLSFTQSRLYFGSRNYNQPSRFIRELPEKLVELEQDYIF